MVNIQSSSEKSHVAEVPFRSVVYRLPWSSPLPEAGGGSVVAPLLALQRSTALRCARTDKPTSLLPDFPSVVAAFSFQ